jgi:hypothetical protein
MPYPTPTEIAVEATKTLIRTLQNPIPSTPFAHLPFDRTTTIQTIADIFQPYSTPGIIPHIIEEEPIVDETNTRVATPMKIPRVATPQQILRVATPTQFPRVKFRGWRPPHKFRRWRPPPRNQNQRSANVHLRGWQSSNKTIDVTPNSTSYTPPTWSRLCNVTTMNTMSI